MVGKEKKKNGGKNEWGLGSRRGGGFTNEKIAQQLTFSRIFLFFMTLTTAK